MRSSAAAAVDVSASLAGPTSPPPRPRSCGASTLSYGELDRLCYRADLPALRPSPVVAVRLAVEPRERPSQASSQASLLWWSTALKRLLAPSRSCTCSCSLRVGLVRRRPRRGTSRSTPFVPRCGGFLLSLSSMARSRARVASARTSSSICASVGRERRASDVVRGASPLRSRAPCSASPARPESTFARRNC